MVPSKSDAVRTASQKCVYTKRQDYLLQFNLAIKSKNADIVQLTLVMIKKWIKHKIYKTMIKKMFS